MLARSFFKERKHRLYIVSIQHSISHVIKNSVKHVMLNVQMKTGRQQYTDSGKSMKHIWEKSRGKENSERTIPKH